MVTGEAVHGPAERGRYALAVELRITMTEILTSLLVLITGFYAWVTYRILRANEQVLSVMNQQVETMREQAGVMQAQTEALRQQTDALMRPYITIKTYLVRGSKTIYLNITNAGKSAAENLRLKPDRDFHRFGDATENKNLANLNAFQNTIDCFPPSSQLTFSLAQGIHLFSEGADPNRTPPTFSIKAIYSYGDKTYDETTIIDLRQYLNTEPEPNPLIDQLKEIKEVLKQKK